MALIFDYNQRAKEGEILASKKIAEHYGIEHKVVELPFLAQISKSALNDASKNVEFDTLGEQSAKAVWVPNRNGLFVNIAASYADSFGYDFIIIGANKEEAQTFPDNGLEFLNRADSFFEYSTMKQPKVLAPLKDMEKFEIINCAIENNVPLNLLKSCYKHNAQNPNAHCGVCESCKRLKMAILKSSNKDLNKLFF